MERTLLSILMQKKTVAFLAVLMFILAGLTAFIYVRVTDMTVVFRPSNQFWTGDSADRKQVISVGVVSRYPPSVIYQGYQPIMDYLTRSTPYRFTLRLSSSYQQTVDLLANGTLSVAFLGTYIYVQAQQKQAVECLLKPLNENGEPYSHAVVIVRDDSPIRSIGDLRHKRVAFPSKDSFSGNWLPRYELQRHHIAFSDLDSVCYLPHHQSVVYQVLKGTFDAGVVKERVAREFLPRGIRILYTSEAIPGSPIVASRSCPREVSLAVRSALLRIDTRRPEDRALIETWDPEFQFGFAAATDRDYDAVRAILRAVEKK